MKKMLMYPTVTDEMMENCGICLGKYDFTYLYNNEEMRLQQTGTSSIKLTDPLDIWDIETEGLLIKKEIHVAYPDLLKGYDGVACKNADIGICILWTNRKLTQTGCILPISDVLKPDGRVCTFNYSFPPGRISGDLELCVQMYIKKKADIVLEDEAGIINEEGVSLGEIEYVVLDLNDSNMKFPIEEYKSADEPLWWIEFSEWEDPKTVDMFTRDSLCLYLNTYYEACPSPSVNENSNSIRNIDVLVDILAQAYFLMFKRLSDEDLKATKSDVGLEINSICSVLHQFIEGCYEELHWESDEKLLKSLQINIRKKLLEE